MKISKQARREAKELFLNCLTDGLLDDGRVRRAVQQVLQAKPRGYLAILTHFQRLVKLAIEQRTARIESAVALTPDLQDRVRASLEQTYGPGLAVSYAQNPALVGGVRIRVGSDVYDGSIAGRLAALQESFN